VLTRDRLAELADGAKATPREIKEMARQLGRLLHAAVSPPKCEGCGAKATKQDAEGVDLCSACYHTLTIESSDAEGGAA